MSRTTSDGDATARAHGTFLTGAVWMTLAALGFACMIGIIRHVSTEVHPFVVAFFRFFFSLMFMIPWLLRVGLGGLRTDHLGLHGIRAGLGLFAMLCWFWGLAHMPLAEAVALNFTAPLFTTVLAIFVLGEVVHARRWSATIIGFLGTLIILRPGAVAITDASLIVLLASLFMACSGIAIKLLSRTESSSTIVAYMALFLTPLSLVPALFVWTTPSWTMFMWLILLGGLATASHICLSRSFAAADASAIMPFDYARLPFAAAIGYVAFDQTVDIWTWVGAGIIAASGLYIAHREVVLGRSRTVQFTAGDRPAG